jgi:hypothetical protein
MRARAELAVAGALLVLATSADTRATVMPALPLDRLVAASHLVVVGTVIEREPAWEGRFIVTRNRVLVERVVVNDLGISPMQVTVATLGGVLDSVGLWVPGEARLERGAGYLLFLHETQAGLVPSAMSQSALEVIDTPGGRLVLPSRARRLVDPSPAGWTPAMPFLVQPAGLDELTARIRRLARRERR